MPRLIARLSSGVVFASISQSASAVQEFQEILQMPLVLLVLLQALAIVLLLRSRRRRADREAELNDPALQKTKYQLRREIARHETTEELLLETREYLHGLINSLPAIVIGVDDEGLIIHWNDVAKQVTGITQEDALGQQITSVLTSPEVTVEQVLNTIQNRTPYRQGAVPKGSGTETSYWDVTIQPLVSNENRGAVVVIKDVTFQVRVERSMIQNEKMLSLGRMAAGLAHEINNPLAAILSNSQTISRRLTAALESNHDVAKQCGLNFGKLLEYLEKRDILRLLQDLQNAGDRAAGIVKTMLEFSHAYQQEFVPTDMASLIDRCLELAANTIGLNRDEDIKMPFVIRDFNSNMPSVMCSASEIQQVLLNLLLNAAQAIHYAEPAITNPTLIVRLTFDKQYASIELEDNGPGMDEATQKQIFEPFFTTKSIGSGTGLGLSVSYFIVKDHHQGQIEVQSIKGQGTKFTIRLPLLQHQ